MGTKPTDARVDLEVLDKFKTELKEKQKYIEKIQKKFIQIWPEDVEQNVEKIIKNTSKIIGKNQHEIKSIEENRFYLNVAVVGGYSAGKSTFLNSLLRLVGEKNEIFPAGDEPVTEKLTKIQPSDITEISIEDSKGNIVERITDIEYSEIRDKLNELVTHQSEQAKEDISLVTVNVPFPDLLTNIRFFDTPGADSPEDDFLDPDSLEIADILIWVIDEDAGGVRKAVLDKMKELHKFPEKNAVIINKVDCLLPRERENVRKQIQDTIPFEGEIHFYSALEVVKAEAIIGPRQAKQWINKKLDKEFENTNGDGEIKIVSTNNQISIENDNGNTETQNWLTGEYRDMFVEVTDYLGKLFKNKEKYHLDHIKNQVRQEIPKNCEKIVSAMQDAINKLDQNKQEYLLTFKSFCRNSRKKIRAMLVDTLQNKIENLSNDYFSKKCLFTSSPKKEIWWSKPYKEAKLRKKSFDRMLSKLTGKFCDELAKDIETEIKELSFEHEKKEKLRSALLDNLNHLPFELIEKFICNIAKKTKRSIDNRNKSNKVLDWYIYKKDGANGGKDSWYCLESDFVSEFTDLEKFIISDFIKTLKEFSKKEKNNLEKKYKDLNKLALWMKNHNQNKYLSKLEYKDLQGWAKKIGIPANESRNQIIEKLATKLSSIATK